MPRKSAPNKPPRTRKPAAAGAVRAQTVDLDPEEREDEAEETEVVTPSSDRGPIDPRKIPRAHRLKQDEFETFLKEYPETQGTMFYLYRLEPKIDRTYTGGDDAESNIDKGPHQKFSLAWLKTTWGSGRYQVRFKDGGKQVCDSVIDINEYTDFPPEVDVRELVDCDSNRPFINNLIARGKAFRDAQGFFVPNDPQKQPVSNGAPADVTAILDKAFQYAEKLNRNKTGDGKLEEHAGMKTVDLLGGVTEKLIASMLGGKQGNGGESDRLTLALITMLTNAQNQQQTMMMEFFKLQSQLAQNTNQGGGGGNSINSAMKILELLGTLGILPKMPGAADGAEPAAWWEKLINSLAPEVAGIVKAAITLRSATPPAPASGPPASVASPKPAAPVATTPAAGEPAGGIPVGGNGIPVKDAVIDVRAEPAEAPAPAPAANQQVTAEDIERNQIISLGNHAVQCLERGIAGADLAASIVTLYDLQAYAAIARHGKDGILKKLQSIPEVWAPLVILQDQLEEFIEDFLSYGKQDKRAA